MYFHNNYPLGIQGELANKTRIVVMSSHQDLAREADFTIIVAKGEIQQIMKNGN